MFFFYFRLYFSGQVLEPECPVLSDCPRPSLWGIHLSPPDCNPVCVVPARLRSLRAHPGVNLDHGGNYCLGVHCAGAYEQENPGLTQGGVREAVSASDLEEHRRGRREEIKPGARADVGMVSLTEFQHCGSLSSGTSSLFTQLVRTETQEEQGEEGGGEGGKHGGSKAYLNNKQKAFLSPFYQHRSQHCE